VQVAVHSRYDPKDHTQVPGALDMQHENGEAWALPVKTAMRRDLEKRIRTYVSGTAPLTKSVNYATGPA